MYYHLLDKLLLLLFTGQLPRDNILLLFYIIPEVFFFDTLPAVPFSNKRAKTVGIPPLPSRRPTKGQRAEWEDSIVKAEGL